ncbi:MAG: DUF3320 domain-containing protein, partial [Christensenellales bacterium]
MARFEPERPFFARTGKAAEPFLALEADHPLMDMTDKDAVALQLSKDGEAELSASQEYRFAILSAQHEKSKKLRGVPLLYAGAVMLRFVEGDLRVNAPALLIPVRFFSADGKSPVRVSLCFDDAEPNGPLFDVLRRRFDFEPEWPPHLREGMEGIQAAFQSLKKAVRPGWGVYDEIILLLFDLSEWHLYSDSVNRAEQIAHHPVAAVLSSRTPFPPVAIPEENEDEEPLALPLFADSAQRSAVRTVALGNSLLLSGESGTGKRTTAANAALHALYSGKTVLYAAQSGEARKAFSNLLENSGSRGFCLDLGENLPNHAIEKPKSAGDFEASARRLNRLRARCDALANPSTSLRSCGLRFYELAEACTAYENVPDAIAFSDEEASRIRRDTFVHLRDLCGQLVNAGRAVGHPANHPLAEIRQKFYSKAAGEELPALLETAKELAEQTHAEAVLLCAQWNLPKPVRKAEFEQLSAMAAAAAQWDKLPHQWLQAEDMTAFLAKVKELIGKGKRVSETRTRLLCTFAEPALAADVEAMAAQWAEAEKSLVTRATVQGKLFKEIAAMLRHGVRVDKKQVPGLLSAIAAYQKDLAALQKLLPELSGLLNSFWKDVYTDWIKVEGYCRTAQSVNEALLSALGSQEACAALYHRAAESGDLSAAKRFDAAWKRLQEAKDRLFDLLDVEDGFDATDTPYPLALAEAFGRWNGGKGLLKDWMNWRLDREKAVDAGLAAVVDAYEKGLPHDDLIPAFERGLYAALAKYVFDKDAELQNFSAELANEMLDELCSLDETVREEAKQAISFALWERAPKLSPKDAPYSEQGMFQKALTEPNPSFIRMFERMPGLMPKRFPVVVASVADAARLPKSAQFDLVIVDGADAMVAEKAAGLLARGRNCLLIDRGMEQQGSLTERLRAAGMPEITLRYAYARTERENAWSDAVRISVRHTESAVFAALAAAMGDDGWQCRFFADRPGMLLMNKVRPVSPLFGVTTDGPELKELSLSDRELFRAQPLRRAGHRIYRFWYPRWWRDRDDIILELIELAESTQREADLQAALKRTAAAQAAKNEVFTAEPAVITKESGAEVIRETAVAPPAAQPVNEKFPKRRYVQAELVPERLQAQDLFDPSRAMLLKAKLADAIMQEAPIAKTLLVKRVLSACGIKRAGARMAKAVGALAEELDFPKTTDKDTGE